MSALLHAVPVSYLVLNSSKANAPATVSEVDLLDSTSSPVISPPRESQSAVRKTSVRGNSAALSNVLRGVKSDRNFTTTAKTETGESVAQPLGALAGDDQFPTDPMSGVKESAQGWSGAVQYGNLMGLKFTLESLGFFQALHARIEGQLVYPDDFSRQRITGKVRIEAELARDGKLIRFISSQADDRLLQTYCFAVLVQMLSQPLPKPSWLGTPSTFVAFDFDFSTRVHGNIPPTLRSLVEKNRLTFARENEIDPWLNERLQEVLTRYIPPIIPIPGGFYIDVILAYKYVNNLMNDEPTERELRGERLTKLHELLRMALKQMGTEPRPSPTPEPNS